MLSFFTMNQEMMERFSLFVLVLVLSTMNATAQTLQRDSLAGSWICLEASISPNVNVPKEEMEAFKVLQSGVINSKFLFKQDGLFQWQFPESVNSVFKELTFLNGQPWSIDTQKDFIHIGKPRENLMQIMVIKKDGITYFVLSDTPLMLRMQKQ
jgi:hypothetical protein